MRALERKLTRDLWQLRGQVLTVALVVAGGIAGFTVATTVPVVFLAVSAFC